MASFTTVILPLDGSAYSDAAIPYAATLARVADAEIVLLRVLEIMRPIYDVNCRDIIWIDPSNPRLELPAPEILLPQLSRLVAQNLRVRVVIRLGDPRDEILAEAARQPRAITALASHGRGGLERVVLGSVVSAVLRSSPCPVLVVRPGGAATPRDDVAFREICVALDGSDVAAQALEPAKDLARAAGATLRLVRVAETYRDELPPGTASGMFSPSYPAILEHFTKMEGDATHYLEELAENIRSEGLTATHDVLSGNPARQLLTYVAQIKPDLLVMASHGRGGFGRWLMGSVADKLMTATTVPLLIVRTPESIPAQFRRELAGPDTPAGLSSDKRP